MSDSPQNNDALRGIHWERWNNYLLVAASAHFALFYTLNTRPLLNLSAFEAGQERAPFQYRVLTALLYRFADNVVHIPPALAAHLPPSMGAVHDFVTLILSFASLLVACIATRLALERLTGESVWSHWGALLVLPMAYYHYLLEFGHPCCTPMQLPYDLPSLAFFAAVLALIVAGRVTWLYPVFAIASLNRESTLFLIAMFALWHSASLHGRQWRSRQGISTMIHVLSLSAIWVAVHVLLKRWVHPPPVPGPQFAGFEIHVLDNLGYLFRPYYWSSFLSMFGFTWIFLYAHWRNVPNAGVRRMLWIGPVYLGAMYVVGVLSEIRIFGELIPLFAVAFVLLLRQALGVDPSLPERTGPAPHKA